jgi:S1-C subfamily serine protease
MKRFATVALALIVSACVTTTNEPRTIDVSTGNIEPSAALIQNLEALLIRTSSSYVTLVVHDKSMENISRVENLLTDAVTSGSGFVVDASEGYILTAGHVAVAPGWRVQARGPDGQTILGEVVNVFPSNDIALIKLERSSGLSAVVPAASACMSPGDGVFSLGKPRELGDIARLGEVNSMSFGRPVSYNGFGYPDAMVLSLQTRKGESGGPVFNTRGELAGMLVSTLSDSNGTHLDLAHAVPTPNLARFLCDNMECSAQWRSLTGSDTHNCSTAQAASSQ